MASMTIRNLSDDIKQRLRIQAAEHGHSMEEEARIILRAALMEHTPPINLARAIHDRFAPHPDSKGVLATMTGRSSDSCNMPIHAI